MLTFSPPILSNLFIRLSSFLMESIRFSIDTVMSSANSDTFFSCFSIWMPFICFSCLIAVSRTSTTLLNRNGESWHPCLVRDPNGKALSFCPLSMMLTIGLSCMAFIMLRNAPSIHTLLRVLTINGCCTLSNAFSTSIDMIM